MNVPAAVQRNAARADELSKQFAAQRVGEPASEPTDNEPVEDNDPQAGREDWKGKYHALQGKYDAEVPQLHRTITELSGQVQQLHGMLANLNSQQPRPAPASSPTPKEFKFDPTSVMQPDELDEYGEDVIKVMGRVANHYVKPLIEHVQSLEADNARLKNEMSGVSQNVTQSARQSVFDRLAREIGPNWHTEINQSPEFAAWLEHRDPLFGMTRRDALMSAFNANNAEQVVRVFKAFQEDANLSPASGSQPAAAAPGPSGKRPQRPLETLAAPGKGRPGTNGGAPSEEAEFVSREEIARFYADVRAGAFKGRDEERAKIEAKIHALVKAGRVTA